MSTHFLCFWAVDKTYCSWHLIVKTCEWHDLIMYLYGIDIWIYLNSEEINALNCFCVCFLRTIVFGSMQSKLLVILESTKLVDTVHLMFNRFQKVFFLGVNYELKVLISLLIYLLVVSYCSVVFFVDFKFLIFLDGKTNQSL